METNKKAPVRSITFGDIQIIESLDKSASGEVVSSDSSMENSYPASLSSSSESTTTSSCSSATDETIDEAATLATKLTSIMADDKEEEEDQSPPTPPPADVEKKRESQETVKEPVTLVSTTTTFVSHPVHSSINLASCHPHPLSEGVSGSTFSLSHIVTLPPAPPSPLTVGQSAPLSQSLTPSPRDSFPPTITTTTAAAAATTTITTTTTATTTTTTTNTSNQDNETKMSGMLKKEGGRIKSWKSRFCVLQSISKVLLYYKSQSAVDLKRPLGVIPLVDVIVEPVSSGGGVVGGSANKKCRFIIRPFKASGTIKAMKYQEDLTLVPSNHRHFVFEADSTANQMTWVEAIIKCIHTSKEQ
ncbi:hypothetical protein DFA_06578 [Cavenderia fasciculata]|uniref:PH domain-containing protein n=1 Tax=Cavenderia fasciculata TaxID=261658 RepID=F4PJE2_CACFS|nr:uncharacterized protein DFA_06578 [Cavenderia fasciculata]EGG24428.1 hypothetical protein DFA_06578 [Cavenderia fasciculata]|eukprot:XP_004362279.1 hypothetical protein DFA_06578 [Cavenderia fasciculata]